MRTLRREQAEVGLGLSSIYLKGWSRRTANSRPAWAIELFQGQFEEPSILKIKSKKSGEVAYQESTSLESPSEDMWVWLSDRAST